MNNMWGKWGLFGKHDWDFENYWEIIKVSSWIFQNQWIIIRFTRRVSQNHYPSPSPNSKHMHTKILIKWRRRWIARRWKFMSLKNIYKLFIIFSYCVWMNLLEMILFLSQEALNNILFAVVLMKFNIFFAVRLIKCYFGRK